MALRTKPTTDLTVTTTEHRNAIATRAAFEAFARGDLDAVRAHLTPDCTWTNAGTSPVSGVYQGWEQIAAMFGNLFTATGGTFSMNLLSVLADDQRSVAIYDATSTVNGTTATERFVLIDELTSDGKVTATQTLAYDQARADAHLIG